MTRKREIRIRMAELQAKDTLSAEEQREYTQLEAEYQKIWEQAPPIQEGSFEELRMAAKAKPTPIGESTGAPKRWSSNENRTYKCKHCTLTFPTLHELGNHMRRVRAEERKRTLGRSQLSPVPTEVPAEEKIIKVERIGDSTRIYSTFFMPKDAKYVRVSKPIEDLEGFWVHFEVIERGKQ